MQAESKEKLSQGSRLKNLRLKRQCNWAEIAKDVGLSEAMIYGVISGKKNLSDKALHRLGEVEWAAGIAPPPVLHAVTSEQAEHIIANRATHKKGIAKLRRLVAELNKALNELEL